MWGYLKLGCYIHWQLSTIYHWQYHFIHSRYVQYHWHSIIRSQSACTHISIISKTAPILVLFQKFCKFFSLWMCKILLHIHLTHTLTCVSPKSGRHSANIDATTVKTVLAANLRHRNTLFRVCVQMCGKNSLLKLDVILLHNHLTCINAWKAAMSDVQTTEFAFTMSTLTTVQNAMDFGQISKLFPNKLSRIFLNKKKTHYE